MDEVQTLVARVADITADGACPHITRALNVIKDMFSRFESDKVCLSFNGGKDCTVVLHLLRVALVMFECGVKDVADVPFVYFSETNTFAQVDEFIESTVSRYFEDYLLLKLLNSAIALSDTT